MPMCNEHFGVFEGKLKLPFIRGEHSPSCQSFRGMEEAIGSDLNNWLCNAYIEVLKQSNFLFQFKLLKILGSAFVKISSSKSLCEGDGHANHN